jgi:exosortase
VVYNVEAARPMLATAAETTIRTFSWRKLGLLGLLLVAAYAPILWELGKDWMNNPDMGHGVFVPVVAGYIAWKRKDRIAALPCEPNPWGLLIVGLAMVQLVLGTLGSELFLSRTAFVFSIFGIILATGGMAILKELAFPAVMLFFMVPIPAIIYSSITFPLQLLASRLAEWSLVVLGIPVLREGNILELVTGPLSVVEACSGIRSLLSLTFFSLIYGYMAEKRTWIRAVLFLATVPIALIANGSRVSITAILAQIDPALADGLYHEFTGLVVFFVAIAILVAFHRLVLIALRFVPGKALA